MISLIGPGKGAALKNLRVKGSKALEASEEGNRHPSDCIERPDFVHFRIEAAQGCREVLWAFAHPCEPVPLRFELLLRRCKHRVIDIYMLLPSDVLSILPLGLGRLPSEHLSVAVTVQSQVMNDVVT